MPRFDPEALIARAAELLRLPRIGLLWCRGALPSPWTVPGTRGIHYLEAPCPLDLRPLYVLEGMPRPEGEARTLAALVVFQPPAPLAAELVSGLAVCPAARLVTGCLEEGLPVLLDPSRLEAWLEGPGSGSRSRWAEARRLLEGRGVRFLGSEGAEPAPETRGLLRLGPGWHPWTELVGRVEGCSALVLAPGAKLTPEALERLRRLQIPLREEGVPCP